MGAAVAGTTSGPQIPATKALPLGRRGPQNGLEGLVWIGSRGIPSDRVLHHAMGRDRGGQALWFGGSRSGVGKTRLFLLRRL